MVIHFNVKVKKSWVSKYSLYVETVAELEAILNSPIAKEFYITIDCKF